MSCSDPKPAPPTSVTERVRPEAVRRIALWWQGELKAASDSATPPPPAHADVIDQFGCTEEEALRGVGLGEHRYFSGVED